MEVFLFFLILKCYIRYIYHEVAVLGYGMFPAWLGISLLKFKGIMIRRILHSMNSSTQHGFKSEFCCIDYLKIQPVYSFKVSIGNICSICLYLYHELSALCIIADAYGKKW